MVRDHRSSPLCVRTRSSTHSGLGLVYTSNQSYNVLVVFVLHTIYRWQVRAAVKRFVSTHHCSFDLWLDLSATNYWRMSVDLSVDLFRFLRLRPEYFRAAEAAIVSFGGRQNSFGAIHNRQGQPLPSLDGSILDGSIQAHLATIRGL